ncbi:MAG: Flp pilus assembly protein CpaB [Candidatus Melainabacteria bacterium]|nr:MAG: Flp pilus assembly protein CpaB [Candidatus Melainabacteria bacterium]
MPPTVTPDIASILKERSASVSTQRTKNNWLPMVMIVAMVLFILAGVLRSSAPKAKTDLATVVGAATDIAPGTRLSFSSLHYVQIPTRYHNQNMLESNEQVVGSIAKYFIARGEPICKNQLFAHNQFLSANLETHERAISLKLDDDAAVDRTIGADDVVDAVVTIVKDGKHYTKTIAQNVRVLLAGSKEALESRSLRNQQANVTLAATPEQCQAISAAQESGKLKLVLRSRLSTTVNNLPGISEDDLLPGKAFEKERPVPAPMQPIAMPSFAQLIPPPTALAPEPEQAALPTALGWVVEVFAGNKKESVSVGDSANSITR